jgi:hypothetical protein
LAPRKTPKTTDLAQAEEPAAMRFVTSSIVLWQRLDKAQLLARSYVVEYDDENDQRCD